MSATPANITNAMYFDVSYYFANNPDVAKQADDLKLSGPQRQAHAANHYRDHGWKEGRNPNALFDTKAYLQAHKDVRDANINPWQHYREVARSEPHRLPIPVGGHGLGAVPGEAALDPAVLCAASPPEPMGFLGASAGEFSPVAAFSGFACPVVAVAAVAEAMVSGTIPAGPEAAVPTLLPTLPTEGFAVFPHGPDAATIPAGLAGGADRLHPAW